MAKKKKINPPKYVENENAYGTPIPHIDFEEVNLPKDLFEEIGSNNPSLQCLTEGLQAKYKVAFNLLFECELILKDVMERIAGSDLEGCVYGFLEKNEVMKVARLIKDYEQSKLPF